MLPERLQALVTVFESHCSAAGLDRVTGHSIGTYPRVHFLGKRGLINVYVDFVMGLDSNGKRFVDFPVDPPFSLSVGAEVFVTLGDRVGRFSKIEVVIPEQPLSQFVAMIDGELARAISMLKAFSEESLRQTGRFVELVGLKPKTPPGG